MLTRTAAQQYACHYIRPKVAGWVEDRIVAVDAAYAVDGGGGECAIEEWILARGHTRTLMPASNVRAGHD